MRKYPEKYLEILKNETIEIENNGVKIIVKPSPGEEREGYLDPCEKAIMEGHWASKTADNNQQQKEEASVDEIIDGQSPRNGLVLGPAITLSSFAKGQYGRRQAA